MNRCKGRRARRCHNENASDADVTRRSFALKTPVVWSVPVKNYSGTHPIALGLPSFVRLCECRLNGSVPSFLAQSRVLKLRSLRKSEIARKWLSVERLGRLHSSRIPRDLRMPRASIIWRTEWLAEAFGVLNNVRGTEEIC